MKFDIPKHFKKSTVILFFTAVAVFIVSIVFFIFFGYSYRRTFVFEGIDKNRLYVENRYFNSDKYIDTVELYVSELLLGPNGNRLKNIFAPGTRLNSCFFDPSHKVLYVDLSKEAVFPDGNTMELRKAVKIFKKNIKDNFISIDKIIIFIDGESLNIN